MNAAKNDHKEIVRLLLNSGADINQQSDNYSALLLAAGNGHIAVVSALMEKGVDINLVFQSTLTAAISANQIEVAQFLTAQQLLAHPNLDLEKQLLDYKIRNLNWGKLRIDSSSHDTARDGVPLVDLPVHPAAFLPQESTPGQSNYELDRPTP